MVEKKETYYAPSTPLGRSATATTRISGPKALNVVSSITKKPANFFKHKNSSLVDIYNKNNNLVDRAVVVYYQKPNSYTGENMVEIHTHGNPTIVAELFRCLSDQGLRIAERGEFTKTAYLNKKLDLVQAESVLNLINAQTARGVDISLNNLAGALSRRFSQIRKDLILALSLIEFELDVSDTENMANTQKRVFYLINKTLKNIDSLINTHSTAKILSDGARIVITGKPNTGKSTLFNSLVGHNRSIVTSVPGTTRDVVEAPSSVSGFSVVFVDTAGTRKTTDPVEVAGLEKTMLELSSGDLIIFLVDAKPTKDIIKKPRCAPTLVVYNKIDLMSNKKILSLRNNKNIDVLISAKTKQGLKDLLSALEKKLEKEVVLSEGFYITSKRQLDALETINKIISVLSKQKTIELEIFSFEINSALKQFDYILGKTTPDDILNNVFSLFCVGK